jgi:uncharacterized protein
MVTLLIHPIAKVDNPTYTKKRTIVKMDKKETASYPLGTKESQWEEGAAKNITFIITEDCQLRCKYCYIIGKNKLNRMDFDIAKKSIDYMLSNQALFPEKAVIWDFIGGEPLLEIELIDRICDYIKTRTYETDHPWFNNYRFNFTTNGILYGSDRVQEFINKNIRHLNITLTLDGTENKHDINRIYPNGAGSYKDIVKNIPLWQKQFPGSRTKVTISSDDLRYVKESILHLWQLGIHAIDANVVSEDVWKEGDDIIFKEQLIGLADEIIDKELYKQYNCSLFSDTIGKPITDNRNWCGAGKMIAIDSNGTFYPCLRFAEYSLNKKGKRDVGNCHTGVNLNKIRPFLALDIYSQSTEECVKCEVATGCSWCQGNNYDYADSDTIYQRATFICKMHKARVEANNYYWNKINQ